MNIRTHIKRIENLVPGKLNEAEQVVVFNTLEAVLHLFDEQSKLLQVLKDEINRLKGEQGKPKISGKNQKEEQEERRDISSEKERKKKKSKRKAKRVKFDGSRRIDDKEVVEIEDKSELPEDIEFKG